MKNLVRIMSCVLIVVSPLLVLSSCACPNENPAVVKAKLTAKGYEVKNVDFSPLVFECKTDAAIIAVKYGDERDMVSAEDKIIIYYFKTKEYADEGERSLIEEEKENSEFKRRYEQAGKKYDITIGRKGNIVWTGTKQAVKDAS